MYFIWVDRNSNLADQIGYWGWYSINYCEMEKYEKMGYTIHFR